MGAAHFFWKKNTWKTLLRQWMYRFSRTKPSHLLNRSPIGILEENLDLFSQNMRFSRSCLSYLKLSCSCGLSCVKLC